VYLLNAEYIGFGKADTRKSIAARRCFRFFLQASSESGTATTRPGRYRFAEWLGPVFLYLAGKRIADKPQRQLRRCCLHSVHFLLALPGRAGGFVSNCNGHGLLTDCPALTLILLSFGCWCAR